MLRQTRRFEIELIGLNLSPSTVFVQAFPSHDALASLRQRIINALRRRAPELRLKPRRFPARHIAFSNIVRFLGPIDARSLLRDVNHCKRRIFGTFEVQEIQLVTTDKFLSDKRTEIVRSFSIG